MLRRVVLLSSFLRGGKKGKGKDEVKIEATTDVINIFKDRTDPELKPRSEYPAWLFPLAHRSDEHPSQIGERIYRGEKLHLDYRELKRLAKWSKRSKIIMKNHRIGLSTKRDPRKFEYFEMDLPGGEDSDWDPDDNLLPLLKLAYGAPYKVLIEENLEKFRYEAGLEPPKPAESQSAAGATKK
jgi:hypothetical protein